MNHEQIEQFNLVDRYLRGKLPAEESADFEAHFVDCPQCVAQLKTTGKFLQYFHLVAAEQTLQIASRQPRSAWAHYLQGLFRRPMALVAGGLLVVIVTGAVLAGDYARRLHAELNQAKSLTEQWERR